MGRLMPAGECVRAGLLWAVTSFTALAQFDLRKAALLQHQVLYRHCC